MCRGSETNTGTWLLAFSRAQMRAIFPDLWASVFLSLIALIHCVNIMPIYFAHGYLWSIFINRAMCEHKNSLLGLAHNPSSTGLCVTKGYIKNTVQSLVVLYLKLESYNCSNALFPPKDPSSIGHLWICSTLNVAIHNYGLRDHTVEANLMSWITFMTNKMPTQRNGKRSTQRAGKCTSCRLSWYPGRMHCLGP